MRIPEVSGQVYAMYEGILAVCDGAFRFLIYQHKDVLQTHELGLDPTAL